MRDYARSVFHGSIIGSLLEGNHDLKELYEACKSISSFLEIDVEVWSDIKAAISSQSQQIDTLAEVYLANYDSGTFSQKDMDLITKTFDTTE